MYPTKTDLAQPLGEEDDRRRCEQGPHARISMRNRGLRREGHARQSQQDAACLPDRDRFAPQENGGHHGTEDGQAESGQHDTDRCPLQRSRHRPHGDDETDAHAPANQQGRCGHLQDALHVKGETQGGGQNDIVGRHHRRRMTATAL